MQLCGYADVGALGLIADLRASFPEVPLLALTDANPQGLNIVRNIQHGGRTRPFRADGPRTPSVERVGISFIGITFGERVQNQLSLIC